MPARHVEVPSEDDESNSSSEGGEYKANLKPIIVVLAVELCERLTYYTIAGTQKTYMQNQLGKPPSNAAAINSVFSMLCYMWCIPGGLLADSIGRYKTIILAGSAYCLGTILVGVSVFHSLQQSLTSVFMIGALFLIPIGTGGIKPNISNFGADQIGDETEAQRQCQKSYFSWFYLSINVGVLIAFGYLTNTTTTGVKGLVPEEEGYSFAYGIGAVFMFIAIGTFFAFTSSYTILPGSGLGAFKALVAHLCYATTHGGGWRAWLSVIGFLLLPIFFVVTLVSALMPAGGAEGGESEWVDTCPAVAAVANTSLPALLRRLDDGLPEAPLRRLHGGGGGNAMLSQVALVLGTVACAFLVVANLNTKYIQPMPAKKGASGFSAQEVRQTLATAPFIIVINLCFNLGYNAMNNAFPSSACQMNLKIGGTQLNGAFFNVADSTAIIVFTPLFETCLFPLIGRMKGSPLRLGQKIIMGLLVVALSNGAAAILEIQRRAAPYICGPGAEFSKCAPGYSGDGTEGTRMKDYSALNIFIPFALMGIAEILVNPCMYCFAYEAAPPKVRSLVQAFNLFFNGSVSNAFTAVVSQAMYPNDLDKGHLEYYYFVNVIAALVGVLLYFWLTRCFDHGKQVKEVVRDEEMDAGEEEVESDNEVVGS